MGNGRAADLDDMSGSAQMCKLAGKADSKQSLWGRNAISEMGSIFRGLKLVIRDLMSDNETDQVSYQIEETRSTLPVLAGFHFFAAMDLVFLCKGLVPNLLLLIWSAASLGLLLGLISAYHALGRAGALGKRVRMTLRVGPILVLGIDLIWGVAALSFSRYAPASISGLIDVLAFTVDIIGLLCTFRLPIMALEFVLAPIVVLALRAIWADEQNLLMGASVFTFSLIAAVTALVTLNISFRRRINLEGQLKRDGEVIQLLLNDLGSDIRDWLWETDAEGRLIYHSPQLVKILGGPTAALTGSAFVQEFFGSHDPALAAKLSTGEILKDELLTTKINGDEKYWSVSAKPLTLEGGAFGGYRGVARDITTQRRQENLIARARDEAEQANEAKSQFLGVISHELRTPINAIVGFSEVLSAGQGENLSLSARREYLGTILESAKHLQGLINDVLEATRIERGTLVLDEQPTDAAELVEITVKIVRDHATSARISIVARVIDDVVVIGDMTRLKQVILNVLTNAIKFSPEGGVVNVDMLRNPKGDLVIVVRDAGIGISVEDAKRVFEPFVQVENGPNRRFGGMGLGLAIARRIARMHSGDLELNGETGVGTEARLTLPAARVSWPKSAKGPAEETVAA